MQHGNDSIAGFGKHYASMYEGSLVGKGPVVFSVMGYVIAKQVPNGELFYVELNPELLAFIIGCKVKEVDKAITFLCSPDKRSRTKTESGRRLVKEAEFLYRVVNGRKYRQMGSIQRRREQWREAKRRERNPNVTQAERTHAEAVRNGDTHTAERMEHLSEGVAPTLSEELGGPNG